MRMVIRRKKTQIYESVWGDISSGNENTAIGFHICNLREKLYAASPDAPDIPADINAGLFDFLFHNNSLFKMD